MDLPRAGREYAHWTVATSDTLSNFQVQLTATSSWLTATYAAGIVSLLVYGPDYGTPGDGLGTLVAARCQPKVRCTDSPEVVIRQGDWINLV